jgi:hypothetical protein
MMRRTILLCAPLLILAGALSSATAAAQSAHEGHAAHAHAPATATAPVPAQRWASDAPLREGMRSIRVAVQALEHYEHGHMGIAQASSTVALIDTAVNDIFAHCRLEPEADVALHGLLARFLAGAEAVRTSQQVPVAEIAAMRAALARYPQLFNDPAWDAATD